MDANAFAAEWVRSWNAHDTDAVLAHFAEDPVGRGKRRRDQRQARAARVPGRATAPRSRLRFEVLGVYSGVNAIVINCRDQSGWDADEVLIFDGGLITRGYAAHREPR